MRRKNEWADGWDMGMNGQWRELGIIEWGKGEEKDGLAFGNGIN
jgi:hypothetical protein